MNINHLHTTYIRDGYAFEAYSEDCFASLLLSISSEDSIDNLIKRVQANRLCRAIYKVTPIFQLFEEDS